MGCFPRFVFDNLTFLQFDNLTMLWQVSLMAKNFEKNGGKILDRNFRAVTLHPKSVADDMSACLTHTRCVLLACMRAGVSRFIGENDVLVGLLR